jgi:carbamoyltransferase
VGYSNHDQGKVMGLSPYGSPENAKEKELVKKYWKLLEKYISFNNSIEKLTIKEDLFNFNSKHSAGLKFSNHFYKKLYSISPIFKKKIKGMQINPKLEEHRPYINFIYTVQKFSEEMVFKIVKHFFKKHPEGKSAQNLIIAGGFALNIVSNGNIISSGLVNPKNFYVPAFPADNGSSIGAALSIAAEEYGFKTKQSLENVSLGKEYTNKEVERALKQFKLVKNKDFKFYKEKDLIKETISLLVKNKTIAWFNGGSEFGPRALGNRSILHLLTDPKGNDKVNKIKLRESWRPSALSITENSAPKFIEGIHKAPFMVIAFPIKKSKRNIIISGKHPYPGDETTRPQTVSKKVNPRYWTLLKDVGKKTGVPGLLNTSFNRREPIVELPEEAINTFYYSKGIDALVIENFILFRNEKLEPSIISISEENSVKNSFSKAISSNNKISWDIFWKDLNSLAEKRKPQHFVEVKVNKKKFKMPLFKEIFDQGINNKILQDIFQRRVKNTKREKIHIKTTMEQYKRALEIIFE